MNLKSFKLETRGNIAIIAQGHDDINRCLWKTTKGIQIFNLYHLMPILSANLYPSISSACFGRTGDK